MPNVNENSKVASVLNSSRPRGGGEFGCWRFFRSQVEEVVRFMHGIIIWKQTTWRFLGLNWLKGIELSTFMILDWGYVQKIKHMCFGLNIGLFRCGLRYSICIGCVDLSDRSDKQCSEQSFLTFGCQDGTFKVHWRRQEDKSCIEMETTPKQHPLACVRTFFSELCMSGKIKTSQEKKGKCRWGANFKFSAGCFYFLHPEKPIRFTSSEILQSLLPRWNPNRRSQWCVPEGWISSNGKMGKSCSPKTSAKSMGNHGWNAAKALHDTRPGARLGWGKVSHPQWWSLFFENEHWWDGIK